MSSNIIEKISQLSTIELLAFAATAGIMISLVILLPYKIIQEIKKQKK